MYKNIHIETITIPLEEYFALKQTIIELREQNELLKKQVVFLQSKVEELEEEIRLLKNGRKSKTSSTPPSQDYSYKNRSLREKSTLKTGGQKGHEGNTLQMKEHPDDLIEHRPEYCQRCGCKLEQVQAEITTRKQEIVLPHIQPHYIEHRAYRCRCGHCGHSTESELPTHLKGNIQYGSEVKALVGYLSTRQYLPHNRIKEMILDCFQIDISEGTIDNILDELSEKGMPAYKSIQERIWKSEVVGGDETGIKINKQKGWLFSFQNSMLTFLVVSFSRGFSAIEEVFRNGFPISVYVTDCLAAQMKVKAKVHQVCIAHLLRELNNLWDVYACSWSMRMKELLKKAIEQKQRMQPQEYNATNKNVSEIQQQLNKLLSEDITGNPKKVQTFAKRLRKYQDYILPFLYYPKVPPDNNGTERSIRNAKVKMKVSGQFRSLKGAKRFAVLRSITDTAIKNQQNVFMAFKTIASC